AIPSNTASALWFTARATYQSSTPSNISVIGIVVLGTTGQIEVEIAVNGTIKVVYTTASSICDGNWHQLFLVSSSGGNVITLYIDSVSTTIYSSGTPATPNVSLQADTIGGLVYTGANQYYDGMQGDIAHVAQFNYALTPAQIGNLYVSWRTCWNGDTATARYGRIL